MFRSRSLLTKCSHARVINRSTGIGLETSVTNHDKNNLKTRCYQRLSVYIIYIILFCHGLSQLALVQKPIRYKVVLRLWNNYQQADRVRHHHFLRTGFLTLLVWVEILVHPCAALKCQLQNKQSSSCLWPPDYFTFILKFPSPYYFSLHLHNTDLPRH